MKNNNFFKQILTTGALVFAVSHSQGAKMQYNVNPTGKLQALSSLFKEFVAQSNIGYDLKSNAHLILSKKPTEKLENTIKQIHYASYAPRVQDVLAVMLDKNMMTIYDALRSVLAAGGLDKSGLQFANQTQIEVLGQIFDIIEADVVSDSHISVLSGSLMGAKNLTHSYIAFVDQSNGEVIVFEAGVGE